MKNTRNASATRNCVIYTRFSPRKNAEDCESCEIQEAVCERFAAAHGWTIKDKVRDEAVSGSTDIEGRLLRKAIDALKSGDILLAHKRDRLARDLLIGLQIERVVENKGARVVVASGEPFSDGSPNSNLQKQMLMVVAEWERKMIGERTRIGLRERMRNGERVSSHPPYGWRTSPDDATKIVVDEAEMEAVKRMIRLRNAGETFGGIADILGNIARGGRKFTPTDIRRIILRSKWLPIGGDAGEDGN